MDKYSNYSELKRNNTSLNMMADRQNTDNNYDNNSIFNIINEHKKRLQEIREWRNNVPYTKNKVYSSSTPNILQNNNNNIYKYPTEDNSNNRYFEYQDNIQSNLKTAKDFLTYNNKNNNYYYIPNEENLCQNDNNNNVNDNANSIVSKNIYCDNSIKNNIESKFSTLNSQANNKEVSVINNNSSIKMLEEKLVQKKLKIKSLKANISNLTKEVENLKEHNNDLELKLQDISKNINNQNNDTSNNNEQNLFEKINKIETENKNIQQEISFLQTEIQNKNTSREINNENNNTENTLIQNYINEMNKIMTALNDFIKKIYNSVPSLNQNLSGFTDVIDAEQLKIHLNIIENYINEVGVPVKENKPTIEYNNNNESHRYDDLEKKILEIKEQNMILQKKINERNKSSKKIKKVTKKSSNNSTNKGNRSMGVIKRAGSKIKIK